MNSYYLEPDYYGYRLQVNNGVVYMVGAQVDGVGNFLVVNATDITSIALVGSYRTSGAGPLRDLYIQNGLAYLCGADGLLVVDLTHMQLVGTPTTARVGEHNLIQISVFDNNGTVLAVDGFELTVDRLPRLVSNTLRDSSVLPNQPFSLEVDTTNGVLFTTALTTPFRLQVQVASLTGDGQLASGQLSLTPTFLGSITVPNITYGIGDIYVSGDLVYVAGSVGSGLCIYDVSNPVNIRRIGFYPLYEAKSIQVQGSLAYVGDNYVLRIFDVSNVANIIPLGFYTTPYFVYDLAVENGIAYVAQGYSGFYVYNVANPNSISLLGSTTTGLNHANGIQVQNRIAYVADDRALVVFNVSNPAVISKIISFSVGGASLQLRDGLLAYGGYNNYQLYDVSNLNAIQLLSSYDYTALGGIHNARNNVQIESNFGYVVFNGGNGGNGGMEVWDISDPRNITSLAVYNAFNAWFVKVDGSLAYLVGDAIGTGWLQVLGLSQWQWRITPSESDEGNYRVTVTAIDIYDGSISDSFLLRVEGAPRINGTIPAQYAKLSQSYYYFIPQDFITDPNADSIAFTAKLLNGMDIPAWLSFNGISATFAGTPRSASDVGNYTVVLTATDHITGSVNTTFTLYVDHIPVVGQPIAQQIADINQTYTFNIPEATFIELDGDPLSYSAKRSNGLPLPAWLTFQNNSRLLSGTPNASDAGVYDLAIEASDSYGGAVSAYFSLVVEYFPQVSGLMNAPLAGVGKLWTLTVLSQLFTDADESKLIYSASSADGSGLPSWLSFNPGSLTFFGTPTTVENIALRLRAADRWGAEAEQDFNVTVTHFPVVMRTLDRQVINLNDSFIWTIPNDLFMEPDNEALTYQITGASETIGLPIWLSFNETTLTLSGTPSFNETVEVNVLVWASDSHGANSSAPLQVVAEHFPRIQKGITPALAGVGSPFIQTLDFQMFVDDDAEPLTYSAQQTDGHSLPNWLTFNPQTLTFAGVPLATDIRKDPLSIRVIAKDRYAVSAYQDFNLTVTHFPVLSQPLLNRLLDIGQSAQWTLSNTTFTDEDDKVLMYRAEQRGGAALPSWLSFNASHLEFLGTPNLTVSESYEISVIASDPHGAEVSGQFTLTAEHFPRSNQIMSLPLAGVGKTFINTVSANSFVDDDGESLVYSARKIDGASLPNWLSFNPNSLTFSGIPSALEVGSVGIRLTATDSYGASVGQNVTLTVTHFPVLQASLPDQVIDIDKYYQWQLSNQTFADPDGEVLLYRAERQDGSALPGWLNFDPSNLTWWGLPNLTAIESVALSIIATDPHGATVSGKLTLTAEHFPRANQIITLPLAGVGKVFTATMPVNSFIDDDHEPLIYSARRFDGSALPSWLSFNPTVLAFSGTPSSADRGSVVIRCMATDSYGASAEQNVTLTVTSFPVIQSPLSDQVINIGEFYQWRLSNQTFMAPDGGTLSYHVQRQDGSVLPEWLSFDAQNLTFWGLPNLTISESYPLSIITRNLDGANVSGEFTLVAEHFPQVRKSIQLPVVSVGKTFNVLVSPDSFKDEEGDLTYKAQQDDNSSLPSWISFNSRTLAFSGTPIAPGTLTIRLIATDSYGISISQTFNLNAELFPSLAGSITKDQSALVLRKGRLFNLTVPRDLFNEGSGGALVYSASQADGAPLPSWLSFDNSSLTFIGIPDSAAVLALKVQAQDDSGASISAPLNLVVQLNAAPQVQKPISRQTAEIEEDFNFLVPSDTFMDPNGDKLDYTATQLGGIPLPGWLNFTSDSQSQRFTGKPSRLDAGLLSDKELTLVLSARDDGGLEAPLLFTLVVEGSSYLSLFLEIGVPILSAMLTVFTYLMWRKSTYEHRQGYELAYYVGRELNLKYVDFGKEEGEQYKTHMVRFLDLLNREYNNFYLRLTHQERKSFAVCVSEHIREYKEGDLLLKEADFVDASVNRLLGYGRQGIKELDLAAFEQAMPDLVRASRESWREAEQKGQSQSPTEKWRWNKTEPLYDRLKLCCSRPSREEKSPRHSGLFARTPTGDRSAEPSTSRKNIISEVELENLSSPPALEPSTEQGREEGQVKEKKYEGGRDEMTENRLLIEGEGASGTLDESSAPTEFRTIPRPSGAVSPSSPGPRLFNPHLSSASANNDSVRVSSTSSFH